MGYDPTEDREQDRREDRAEEHADRCMTCGECGSGCKCYPWDIEADEDSDDTQEGA